MANSAGSLKQKNMNYRPEGMITMLTTVFIFLLLAYEKSNIPGNQFVSA